MYFKVISGAFVQLCNREARGIAIVEVDCGAKKIVDKTPAD